MGFLYFLIFKSIFPILFRTSSHQIVDKQNCLEFPFRAFRSEIRFHTDPGLSWPSFKQPSLDQHILQTSLLALKLLGVTKTEFLLTSWSNTKFFNETNLSNIITIILQWVRSTTEILEMKGVNVLVSLLTQIKYNKQ